LNHQLFQPFTSQLAINFVMKPIAGQIALAYASKKNNLNPLFREDFEHEAFWDWSAVKKK
jgi:hypothetical protein